MKHFAILAYWIDAEDANKYLIDRVEHRPQDRSQPNRERYVITSDIKWVLLNYAPEKAAGKSWNELSNEPLQDEGHFS